MVRPREQPAHPLLHRHRGRLASPSPGRSACLPPRGEPRPQGAARQSPAPPHGCAEAPARRRAAVHHLPPQTRYKCTPPGITRELAARPRPRAACPPCVDPAAATTLIASARPSWRPAPLTFTSRPPPRARGSGVDVPRSSRAPTTERGPHRPTWHHPTLAPPNPGMTPHWHDGRPWDGCGLVGAATTSPPIGGSAGAVPPG